MGEPRKPEGVRPDACRIDIAGSGLTQLNGFPQPVKGRARNTEALPPKI
jgi:hypothetical protein